MIEPEITGFLLDDDRDVDWKDYDLQAQARVGTPPD